MEFWKESFADRVRGRIVSARMWLAARLLELAAWLGSDEIAYLEGRLEASRVLTRELAAQLLPRPVQTPEEAQASLRAAIANITAAAREVGLPMTPPTLPAHVPGWTEVSPGLRHLVPLVTERNGDGYLN